MKNVFIYIIIAFVGSIVNAQETNISEDKAELSKYQQGMKKAFSLWEEEKSNEAAIIFERISAAEPENWLPPFYVSQINIFASFSEKDQTQVKLQLDKALQFLNEAKTRSKENAEILVLEAQYYTAWIVQDGMQYGMKYSPKVVALYQKASIIASDNPHVLLGKIEWEMGSAKYFGKPTDVYCSELKRAVALFDTFKPEGEFYPTGGKEYAEKVVFENCKTE